MRYTRFGGRWCVALLVLASACASTSLTGAWRNPAYTGGAFHKLLVVGTTDSPTDRRVFEDSFVAALRDAGVEAIASHSLIPQDGKIDEPALKNTVREHGLDGVIMTRLVRIDTQTVVTPSYVSTLPSLRYRDSLYGYYSTAWPPYGMAPEVREYKSAVLETTLWNAADSKLVWTGTTSTFAPSSIQSATADFAKVMISELKTRDLL
jgi:hypothetical protein